MNLSVGRFCENNKIFYSIVIFYSVYVVHIFFFVKWAPQVLLHYKSMLHNIVVFCSARMAYSTNHYIASCVGRFSSIPLVVSRTSHLIGDSTRTATEFFMSPRSIQDGEIFGAF